MKMITINNPFEFQSIIKKLKNSNDLHFYNNTIIYAYDSFSYTVNLGHLVQINENEYDFTVLTKDLLQSIHCAKRFDMLEISINEGDITDGIVTHIHVVFSNTDASTTVCSRIKVINSSPLTDVDQNELITKQTIKASYFNSFIKPFNKKQTLNVEFSQYPDILMFSVMTETNNHSMSFTATEDVTPISITIPILYLSLVPLFVDSTDEITISSYFNYVTFENTKFTLRYYLEA